MNPTQTSLPFQPEAQLRGMWQKSFPSTKQPAAGWGEQAAEAGAGWGWKIPPRLHCPRWPEAAARAAGCRRSEDPPQLRGRLPVGLSGPHQAVFAHCLSAPNPCPPPAARQEAEMQAARRQDGGCSLVLDVHLQWCVHHLLLPWTPVPTECPRRRGGRVASRSHPSTGRASPSSAPSRCAQQGRAGAGMEGQRLGEFLRCPWGLPSAEHPQVPHLQPPSARR